MATLKTIAAALKLVDAKKENLKRAFDDVQAHSSLLSSFSLSWSDLDSHFSSLHSFLTHRFHLLESLESTQHAQKQDPPPPSSSSSIPTSSHLQINSVPNELTSSTQPLSVTLQIPDPSSSSNPPSEDRVESVPDGALNLSHSALPQSLDPSSSSNPLGREMEARPEFRALCEKMDGKGLRRYINQHSKEREAIQVELAGAIRCAPDPGAMVLDAMEGFYEGHSKSRGDKDPSLSGVRRSCVLLLEKLMEINPTLGSEVRERAKKLAMEWKVKASITGENPLEALGFLNLLAAYGLNSEFDKGELLDYFVIAARYRQATLLCRAIGLEEKVPELIQKLLDKGKQLLAIKFIFEFELTDRFPPVSILKAHLTESKKRGKEIRTDGKHSLKSVNEATDQEISALKAVIKLIEEHKLEAEYPRESLEIRIEQLEKHKADRKHPATAPATKPQQQQQKQAKQQPKKQQQSGSKRPRTTATVGPAAVPMIVTGANTIVPPFQQSHLQPTGLLSDRSAAYLSSPGGPYGFVGSTPAFPHYAGSPSVPYGLAAPMGFPGNPNPAGSHLYPSESYMPSGYHDGPTPYGGYGLPTPQYHPAYYSQ